ncbi:MAG: hypothetical protein LBQ59_02750 [Candidatus Peribacteria bacterium]|jgi:hypothetical protein|nr:hypothetical protein [Candidatus Peribacteria bacterium]
MVDLPVLKSPLVGFIVSSSKFSKIISVFVKFFFVQSFKSVIFISPTLF